MEELKYEIIELESIEDLGYIDDYVYDIGMVDSPHTFFGNDILVHNSTFFSAKHFIDNMNKKMEDFTIDELISITLKNAKITQDFINDSYSDYVKYYHNIQSGHSTFKIKQENISLTGFWLDVKKRYAQCIIDEEGVRITEKNTKEKDRIYDRNGNFLGKLDVKGIDTRRSDFPKSFKDFLTIILKMILAKYNKKEIDEFVLKFLTELESVEVKNILFPSSVSNIEKYDSGRKSFQIQKGTPIHVKSSLYYNDLLDYYKINSISKIRNHDKVKWCYLKTNPLKLDVLSIKSNDENPKEIVEYIKKYIDYNQMFESKLKNKLETFYECMKWGKVITLQDKHNQNFFGF
jgi:hypothetical protein